MHEDSESLLANRQYPRWQKYFAVAGKRRFIVGISFVALASFLGFSVFRVPWTDQHTVIPVAEVLSETPSNTNSSVLIDPFGPAANLLGPPTANFRDRIPVVPMFIPSHIGAAVPPVDFGLVFDVPRLRKTLNISVLEWHEVKNRSSEDIDEIGCWNTWETVQKSSDEPRHSPVPDHLKLDISYTKAPSWIKVIPHLDGDVHSFFWSLAALAFPEARAENLVPPRESPNRHVLLPPDEQMLCYDYLYYVCANQWIAIHVRRGDFGVFCPDGPTGCYASLDVIARRVDEVKIELLQRKGISVEHVIMTSDERDKAWWEEVKGKGWYGVDHSQTADLLGPWYPIFIDAGIQSLGDGFVGTDKSTMSMLARRRVESWTDGAVRIFKWGEPNSDDH
ncbi:hypothetical protein C0995_012964 [Termitomyces sp. Mi166|nr:hypothetical protein C0995_012964 [Termitomyces sp. Mi166\